MKKRKLAAWIVLTIIAVVAAFCLLSLVAGISNGIAKRLKGKEE